MNAYEDKTRRGEYMNLLRRNWVPARREKTWEGKSTAKKGCLNLRNGRIRLKISFLLGVKSLKGQFCGQFLYKAVVLSNVVRLRFIS